MSAGGSTHANMGECRHSSMMVSSTSGKKTVVAFSRDHVFIMQRDDPMASPIPRLDNYEDVEIMIVARPLRGAEGMGAATVGKCHRSTTYTGVRGPEMPKGKGRRRECNLERAQLYMARDPLLHQALNPKLGIQRV